MSLNELKVRLSNIHNLDKIGSLLGWDQQVNMPPGGTAARAEQLATLATFIHDLFTSDATGKLIQSAEAEVNGANYDSIDASLVRVARRNYDREIKVPTELEAEIQRTTALAHEIWVEARATNDFSKFQPELEKIYDLVRRKAEYLGYKEEIYDALLDLYEPGMTTAEVRRLFGELRQELVPLVAAIAENQDAVDDSILHQDYPIDKQREFGEMVVQKFGFDFQRGRQDLAVHPFCTSFSCDDVRITTRFNADWLSPALFGTMHEAGHGLYEQGSARELDDSILGGGTSLGVHESQSRMWENVIGRSRPFWQHFYPDLQKTFPDALKGVDVESFYKSINASKPSLIRVEADEVTYNLHIMIRFELETAVLNNKLAIRDLPDAWNATTEDYLGITPPDNALGILQDVHWSGGVMGYFPTYALGNLLSIQFYDKAIAAHPEIPEETGRGEFGTLLNWLRENIHRHGSKYESMELVQRVTGEKIQTKSFMNYLRTKYSDIYGL